MSAEVYPSTDIIEPKETAVFRETLQILPFCFFIVGILILHFVNL